MENIDIPRVKMHTKKLVLSVAELADAINEIGKSRSNYKVAETVFRLHKPMRQFQSQLHMISNDFNHTFVQIEDPEFPTFTGWTEMDKGDLAAEIAKLEKLFDAVIDDLKNVSSVDHIHAFPIRASWRVLNDFYEALKGKPRPMYL